MAFKLDSIYPNWKPINVGVPQGSLLSPLFLNIYINDLNFQVTNTTEYASDASPSVLQMLLTLNFINYQQGFSKTIYRPMHLIHRQ